MFLKNRVALAAKQYADLEESAGGLEPTLDNRKFVLLRFRSVVNEGQ